MEAGKHARRYVAMAPRAPEGEVCLPELLPGEGPIELDIGFGRGRSILERAKLQPNARLIGIEIKTKLAYQVQQKALARELNNVRVLCDDVRELLARSGPDACVSAIVVHFPDPWWKKRHTKRRVIGELFLDQAARLLCDRGELYIQTDVEERALLYRDQIAAHEAYELVTESGFVKENPYGARSNREVRALEDGLPYWRILAQRR